MNEFEDIRMNWGSGFFGGRHANELEDIRMNWRSAFYFREIIILVRGGTPLQ